MEMEKNIETAQGRFLLRPYQDEDERKVTALWEAAFRQKIDGKIWRWKFHDCPFGRQTMLCFTEEGDPVTMYSGIPFPAIWNGKKIRMAQLIDNMSHPGYRQAVSGRKGLFVRTAEYYFNVYGNEQNSVFLYGFPGYRHYQLGSLLLGYSRLPSEVVYLEAEPQKIRKTMLFFAGRAEILTRSIPALDEFWEQAAPHFSFSVKRDAAFAKWRYFDHPVNQYQFYVWRNISGKITAYAAVLYGDQGATIVDVLTLPESKGLRNILKILKAECRLRGVEKMRTWMPTDHFITDQLIESGFESKEEPLGIIPAGKSFCKDPEINRTIKNIFYTMGDGDLF